MIADCAQIAETLLQSCPKLKILASSREALRVMGEIVYHVPSLSVPDPLKMPPIERLSEFSAVQLFAERAVAVDPGFVIKTDNAENLVQISQRLDGIPLSIELAAARVNALTVEQIAARLVQNQEAYVIVERSFTSPRESTEYKYPVHPNPQLDLRRREMIVRCLLAMGIMDAEQRVVVAPSFAQEMRATEAQSAYRRGMQGGFGGAGGLGGGGF